MCRSGSGQISFSELCRMLHKLRRDISLREARAQAVNALLLCDRESQRCVYIPAKAEARHNGSWESCSCLS